MSLKLGVVLIKMPNAGELSFLLAALQDFTDPKATIQWLVPTPVIINILKANENP